MNNSQQQLNLNFDDVKLAFEHKSDKQLASSIFIFKMMKRPAIVQFLTKITLIALKLKLPIRSMIKATVFKQFCGGESITDCNEVINDLGDNNVKAILDYSVEGEQETTSFEATKREFISIIQSAKSNDNIPVICIKISGICKFKILENISDNTPLTIIEQAGWKEAQKRLNAICSECEVNNVPIYIDAEESWIQKAVDALAEEMMAKYNVGKVIIFNTLQMYRWDRMSYLKELIDRSKKQNFKLGLKVVRGAYMEQENKRALANVYQSPIQTSKKNTDTDYDLAIALIIEHINHIEFCAGTHNEESCYNLCQLMKSRNLPNDHPHIFFSQLYGMSDNLSFNLAKAGYNVSKYLPYGPVKSTMPYLIRRARENTSISGQIGKELDLLLREKKRRKEIIAK